MNADSLRAQQHRQQLPEAGLRRVQIWVTNTRQPGFAAECERQSLLIAQTEEECTNLDAWMDESASSIQGWTA